MPCEVQHSDLTHAEWQLVQPLLPAPSPGGRPRTLDLRQVVNAILYLQASGCGWRRLPEHFPNPSSVRTYYDRWRKDGTWKRIDVFLQRN